MALPSTGLVERRFAAKLARKGCDLLVVNADCA
jgi:hypothetical protein